MIYRAWELGTQGLNYKEEWADKANSGTLAHALAHGETPDYSKYSMEIIEKAKLGYENYLTWVEQSRLERECSEISLVSEQHQVGGTIDDIWLLNGKRAIGDIKTGKLYYSHMIQVAAYAKVWEENFPDKPIDGGFYLFHFDKENADYGFKYFSNLDDAWEAFIHLRALYDLTSKLAKRV